MSSSSEMKTTIAEDKGSVCVGGGGGGGRGGERVWCGDIK